MNASLSSVKFVHSNIIASPTGEERADKLHESFERWCRRNGAWIENPITLGRALKAAFPDMIKQKRGPRDGRYWVYLGIADISDL